MTPSSSPTLLVCFDRHLFPKWRLSKGLRFCPGRPITRQWSPTRARNATFGARACSVRPASADLVFVDPDNGIEVRSRPVGRKGSSKYVTWQEIRDLWETGCSILIYQHFRREPRAAFAERMISEVREQTGARFTAALRTPYVLYLLAAQERDETQFREAVALLPQRWNGQIEPVRLTDRALHPKHDTQHRGGFNG